MCIDEKIQILNELKKEHNQFRECFLVGTIYLSDIYAAACLNRSLCLLSGFSSMIEAKNFIVAAPILRLQLDNVLRFYALWNVNDPSGFVMEVIKGTRIDKLKDKNGKFMRDSYLVDIISADYPWIKSVYTNCSGYIHLSEKHIFNCWKVDNPDEFEIKISPEDIYIQEDIYLEAIDAFIETTGILLRYMEAFCRSKDLITRPNASTPNEAP